MFLTEWRAFREKTDALIDSGFLRRFLERYAGGAYAARYKDLLVSYSTGGKRIRPYFVRLGYQLGGEEPDDRLLLPALTFEIIQTGLLAQDDVFDRSSVRRGRPSLYMALGGDENAMARAVCLGDMTFFVCGDMLAEAEFPETVRLRAMREMNRLLTQTILGEMMDVEMSDGAHPATEDAIIQMYRQKTAQYTVTGPLRMGLILANAPETATDAVVTLGDNLGTAFQIRDDILGVFGTEAAVGKSVCSDMREGKQTVLSAFFATHATDAQRRKMAEIYGNSASGEAELDQVRALFTATGALAHAEELCRSFAGAALKAQADFPADKRLKELLKEIIAYMTTRTK